MNTVDTLFVRAKFNYFEALIDAGFLCAAFIAAQFARDTRRSSIGVCLQSFSLAEVRLAMRGIYSHLRRHIPYAAI